MVTDQIKAVVLAAGKGTRLQTDDSDAPKVMRKACGKPLLWYVLVALSFIEKKDVVIVVGYKKDDVLDYFTGYIYAEQAEQLGTGHAVMAAESELAGYPGAVLVCYGDMPVVRRETYEALISAHFEAGNDCTILSMDSPQPLPYGRIVRSPDGEFLQITEARDCTPEQLKITELNSGIYVFSAPVLLRALKSLTRNNAQGEYYITDAPAIIRGEGGKVGALKRDIGDEIIGVNTLQQLAQVEEILFAHRRTQFAPT
ncbi:MAG: NTP transferase domain-containing protein [Oscillospiraceae bacterium]|jgi:UDP-N-acetylglucosamine diphosphorylase/glucosamine-1-phosphate N-acetyltransferase|nr:NTP transferase domain-containing protein [Oscillospiraceae bacterium]